MKRLLVICAVAILGIGICSAQDSKWGIRAGLNVSNAKEKMDGYSYKYDNTVGFHIGVVRDCEVSADKFYIQPGLFFTSKAARENIDGDKLTMRINYLQIPILASYRIGIGVDSKVHINAGPYIAVAPFGKVKMDGESFNIFDDEYEMGLKRFDAGLIVGAGVEFSQVYVGLQYEFGLANIADEDIYGSGFKMKTKNLAISLGYNF